MVPIERVSIIGSGNLATSLSLQLRDIGVQVVQVYSKTYKNAKILADKVNGAAIRSISELEKNFDLLILSITDNAYDIVINQLPKIDIPVVHTAGSIPVDIFKSRFEKYGVFYPFQTFNKDRRISFKKIPICVEANSLSLLDSLKYLGAKISENVYELSTEKRKKLHLSGIISNNFSNFLFSLSKKYLEKEGMEFRMLIPLLEETIEKLKYLLPEEAQTGPAARGNLNVIEKHKEMLKDDPRLFNIYALLSENILDYYGKT